MVSSEEEMLQHYFYPKPNSGSLAIRKHFPSAIILSKLQQQCKINLSAKKLGEALTKLGFDKVQKSVNGKRSWVWIVYEKTLEEIEIQSANIDS